MTTRGFTNPRLAALVDTAKRAGWRVEMGAKHYKCYPPDGSKPLIVSTTSKDLYHKYANTRADFRRAGLDV